MGCGTSKSTAVVSSAHANSTPHKTVSSPPPQLQEKEKESEIIERQEAVQQKSPEINNNNEVDTTSIYTNELSQSRKSIRILTRLKIHRPVSAQKQKQKDFIDAQQFLDLSYEEAAKIVPENIDEMWAIGKRTSDKDAINVEPLKNRKGWRTIRIFVSSTFKDFHQEREVLVKEVFPDLRLWCEQRKLRLVECDLRWVSVIIIAEKCSSNHVFIVPI